MRAKPQPVLPHGDTDIPHFISMWNAGASAKFILRALGSSATTAAVSVTARRLGLTRHRFSKPDEAFPEFIAFRTTDKQRDWLVRRAFSKQMTIAAYLRNLIEQDIYK